MLHNLFQGLLHAVTATFIALSVMVGVSSKEVSTTTPEIEVPAVVSTTNATAPKQNSEQSIENKTIVETVKQPVVASSTTATTPKQNSEQSVEKKTIVDAVKQTVASSTPSVLPAVKTVASSPTQTSKPVAHSAEFEKIVEQLRKSTWSTVRRPIRDICGPTADGLRFDIRLADETYDYSDIHIVAKDEQGRNSWNIESYGGMYVVSNWPNPNSGEIQISNSGSKFHAFSVTTVSGSGNCSYSDTILMSFSTTSIAYIPVTPAGDVGPIAWDFDADGKKDYHESLIYEPSDEQYRLLAEMTYLENPIIFTTYCPQLITIENDTNPDTSLAGIGLAMLNICKSKL